MPWQSCGLGPFLLTGLVVTVGLDASLFGTNSESDADGTGLERRGQVIAVGLANRL